MEIETALVALHFPFFLVVTSSFGLCPNKIARITSATSAFCYIAK